MTFIVILITLLVERFFDWSHLRHWEWFARLQQTAGERFKEMSPYLVLAITIVPILAVVLLIQLLTQNLLYGFFGFIFQIIVLIYCLGPKNLWADGYTSINALVAGDRGFAAEKLRATFDVTEHEDNSALHRSLLNHLFIEANKRVFATIFWFFILGPTGALLYRLVALSASPEARTVQAVLDWIPVRIFTVMFALGGHFVQVLNCWRKNASHGLDGNDAMLQDCGAAALGYEDNNVFPNDGSAEKQAIGLLDRSFVIVLVLMAVVELIF
ncbi:MAG: regulatory signaling modulator protein AmpE [Gammaproteobacteria bacterium]